MGMVYKIDSRLMRTIAWLIKPFNPKFLEEYTTVIGETIYLPTKWDLFSKTMQMVILTHEKIHIKQYKRNKLWFVLSYMLLPLPMFAAYFRCKYEAEAYKINIRAGMPIDMAVEELYGPKYLYAGKWFGKERLRKWIQMELDE